MLRENYKDKRGILDTVKNITDGTFQDLKPEIQKYLEEHADDDIDSDTWKHICKIAREFSTQTPDTSGASAPGPQTIIPTTLKRKRRDENDD